MYETLAGMTGTALTEAGEFKEIYDLEVLSVPTNLPTARVDQPDVVFVDEDAKFEALTQDIVERHQAGQPVLVGTVSIEKSERLAGFLKRNGIPHEVLNAKQHAREGQIVAQAGRFWCRYRGHKHGRARCRHHAGRQPGGTCEAGLA